VAVAVPSVASALGWLSAMTKNGLWILPRSSARHVTQPSRTAPSSPWCMFVASRISSSARPGEARCFYIWTSALADAHCWFSVCVVGADDRVSRGP
jgi:hypothetical protein